MENSKKCRRCGIEKHISEFNYDTYKKHTCIECRSIVATNKIKRDCKMRFLKRCEKELEDAFDCIGKTLCKKCGKYKKNDEYDTYNHTTHGHLVQKQVCKECIEKKKKKKSRQ